MTYKENIYTKQMQKELATRIRNNLSYFADPFIYGDYYYDDDNHRKEFKLVKDTCLLINELLSCINIKNKILDMAITDTNDKYNKLDVDAKYETFKMLRNLFIHFPIFDSWNEVYINKELLNWNKPRNSYIEDYFRKYSGKELICNIYTRYNFDDNWYIGCTINIVIPTEIPSIDKLYLNDFMTFADVKRIFCIVDYYLDYLGFDLIQYQHLSV